VRVFYSYSQSRDGLVVSKLDYVLRQLGYEPTIAIDRHIRVHNWRSRLAEALRKSDVAVVILTPENECSPYVMGELWAARVLSQMNKRFVLVPVLCGTGGIPDYVSDLYVANSKGGAISDPKEVAQEIDSIVRDNRDFELAVSDLSPHVFIGHGHTRDWEAISKFLELDLSLVVEEYEKISPLGYTVSARLEQMLAISSLAIVVMSAEDEQQDKTLRARQNVIHEIGLFQGRLGFEKVIVLRHKDCESFTNVSGINDIPYDLDHLDEVFAKIRRVAEREGLLPRTGAHK
jgi:predicted nucleotide-binding protein